MMNYTTLLENNQDLYYSLRDLLRVTIGKGGGLREVERVLQQHGLKSKELAEDLYADVYDLLSYELANDL